MAVPWLLYICTHNMIYCQSIYYSQNIIGEGSNRLILGKDSPTYPGLCGARAFSYTRTSVAEGRTECLDKLLLGRNVLHKHLNTMFGFKFANETRIPVELLLYE